MVTEYTRKRTRARAAMANPVVWIGTAIVISLLFATNGHPGRSDVW